MQLLPNHSSVEIQVIADFFCVWSLHFRTGQFILSKCADIEHSHCDSCTAVRVQVFPSYKRQLCGAAVTMRILLSLLSIFSNYLACKYDILCQCCHGIRGIVWALASALAALESCLYASHHTPYWARSAQPAAAGYRAWPSCCACAAVPCVSWSSNLEAFFS